MNKFKELLGVTLHAIDGKVNGEEMNFILTNGNKYQLAHYQDCCEHVRIAEIIGDLSDLINTPILLAEEVSQNDKTPEGMTERNYDESYTWTFYKLATINGSVTIRWLGESNGYYSESVDFNLIEN